MKSESIHQEAELIVYGSSIPGSNAGDFRLYLTKLGMNPV